MRITTTTSLLLILLSFTLVAGDKPEPRWKAFDQGLAEAKKSEKKIMIDVYTDWCGWCKKLDKEVYGEARVADYLNQMFVSIKLDAESNAGVTFRGQKLTQISLAQSFGVRGYPAIIFLDSNGDNITLVPGFVPAERFLPILKYIGEDHYKTTSWEEYQQKAVAD